MESQFGEPLRQQIRDCGVVAVLVIDEQQHAVPVAEALLRGGVRAMELTLRTPAALPAVARIREAVPEMIAGVGTILTAEQARHAASAGAQFGVAPGANPEVVRAAQQAGLPFAPGIVTPSDLEAALALGCRDTKFFPAEPSGGLPYLQSLAAPYAHLQVSFIPLGGVNQQNLASYLASPLILAVGGTWLAPRDSIQANDWDAIESRAAEARRTADAARQ